MSWDMQKVKHPEVWLNHSKFPQKVKHKLYFHTFFLFCIPQAVFNLQLGLKNNIKLTSVNSSLLYNLTQWQRVRFHGGWEKRVNKWNKFRTKAMVKECLVKLYWFYLHRHQSVMNEKCLCTCTSISRLKIGEQHHLPQDGKSKVSQTPSDSKAFECSLWGTPTFIFPNRTMRIK